MQERMNDGNALLLRIKRNTVQTPPFMYALARASKSSAYVVVRGVAIKDLKNVQIVRVLNFGATV